jgi:hypothetical protein
MESNSTDSDNQRKYISLACNSCRDKHRRCDGQKPCNRCKCWKLECTYSRTRPRGGYRGKPKKKTEIIPVEKPKPSKRLFFRNFEN